CSCGAVLSGKLEPDQCPLFGNACTPIQPVGPCMVSQEGACAATYRYQLLRR
ncbi:MAG: hydrogenase formation protein HypD, partial [Bacillota bacterium]|nr:hydrogenase formation protein HypD [Bacillota bacterium]